MRGGQIVEYTKIDGSKEKALCMQDDQKDQFRGRLFLRVVNDDMTEKRSLRNGKKLITLRWADEVTVIGFIN